MMWLRPVWEILLTGLVLCCVACHSSPKVEAPLTAAAKVKAFQAKCQGEGEAIDSGRSLWVDHGKLTRAGTDLLRRLQSVDQEGLNPRDYLANGPPTEQALSESLVRLAGDLAQPSSGLNIDYIDDSLRPVRPCMAAVLKAVSTTSLDSVLQVLREPNGAAAALRRALQRATSPRERADLARDLATARSIGPASKALLVDTNSAQLWEISANAIPGGMKVVVGMKIKGDKTPPMAALVRWADVNPYWYVPPDLVQQGIARHVLTEGLKYLQQHHYEAVDSYDDDDAHVLNPASINWHAVASGKSDIGVRQLPGPGNMLGRVSFVFPNDYGIYLHDTPGRWIFSIADRHLSHGCIRLENPAGLFRFVFGMDLPPPDRSDPDDEYDPKQPVPLFVAPLSPEGAAALSASVGVRPELAPRKATTWLGIKIGDVFAQVETALRPV